VNGNIFSTGPGGIWVCRPDGTVLGHVVLPELPANVGWGEDGSVLFATARTSVYRIPTKTHGVLLG
jgi:gluconolactonase